MWTAVLVGLTLANSFVQNQKNQELLKNQSDYALKAGLARSVKLNQNLIADLSRRDVLAYSKNSLPNFGSNQKVKDAMVQIKNNQQLADYYAFESGQQARDIRSNYQNASLALNSLTALGGLAYNQGFFEGSGPSLFSPLPASSFSVGQIPYA